MKKLKAYVTWEVELDESEAELYSKEKDKLETDTKEWLQGELGSDFKVSIRTEMIEGDETC